MDKINNFTMNRSRKIPIFLDTKDFIKDNTLKYNTATPSSNTMARRCNPIHDESTGKIYYKTKIFSIENHLPTLWTSLPEQSCEVTEITAEKSADITTTHISSLGQQTAPPKSTSDYQIQYDPSKEEDQLKKQIFKHVSL